MQQEQQDAPMTEPIETKPVAAVERRQARVSDFARPCDKGEMCWHIRKPSAYKLDKEGCLLVTIPSRLYDALCNYWDGLGIVPVNFPANRNPDEVEITDKHNSKLIPAWVIDGSHAEVEIAVDTIWRAFRGGLDTELGGSTVPTSNQPQQQQPQTEEEEVEHPPQVYTDSVLKRLPDARVLQYVSPDFARVPDHKSKSREHQFFDWCAHNDGALNIIEDVYMQMHPSVVEQIDAATGKKHLWHGFNPDSRIIGMSGTGKLYVLARETPAQPYRIFRLDVTLPPEQIEQGRIMVTGQDGKETPEVDINKVWPRFQEVGTVDGPLTFPHAPILTAVSSQASLVSPDMIVLLCPCDIENEYELKFILLPYGAKPVVRSMLSPARGFIPTMLAVSTHSATVLCQDGKDPEGEPYPPHMFIIPLDPTSSLDAPNIHSHFTITDYVVQGLRAPEMDAGEQAVQPVKFTCMAYDELDPYALLIGTSDGGALRYHVKDTNKIYQHPTAVYFSHSTPREIEIANRCVDREKALQNVGRMRAPLLWLHASNTTLGGKRVDESADVTNIYDRSSQRLVTCLTVGHAWSLGDRTRLGNENLAMRKMRPFESKFTNVAARCCISRGSTAAVHVMVTGSVLLVDLRTGLVLGAMDDPNDLTAARDIKPGAEVHDRVFSSLWMDLGRVVVCHSAGNVSFIRRATPEMIAERDAKRKEREAKHAEMLKKLEEDTAKLSVKDNTDAQLAKDAAMTDQS